MNTAERLRDCVADVDSVIIAAAQQPGQPPLVNDTVLRAMRPGVWLVNIARGALLDADAAFAHLNTGHLAGIGLDVFATATVPGRRSAARPTPDRDDRPHRLAHQRLLRGRQQTTWRRPGQLPQSSSTRLIHNASHCFRGLSRRTR